MDQATVDAVITDWKTAPVNERLRSALRLLETQTLRPHEITPGFVAELVSSGLDHIAMEDVVTTGFHFNFINRVTDAYDFPLSNPKQQSRQARLLNFLGRAAPLGKRSDPSWVLCEDKLTRPVEIEIGRQHLFNVEGVTDPLLRKAVEAYAARRWQGVRCEKEAIIPDVLKEYLDPLSLHAYRITDELIEKLKSAGLTDAQLFELTFAAAFGAAMPALENLYRVIHG